MRRGCVLAVLAVSAMVGASCGSDSESGTAGTADDGVVELLIAQGAPAAEASCYASELSQFSQADLEEFFASESEEDLDLDIVEAFNAAAASCATAGEDEAAADDEAAGEDEAAGDDEGAAAAPPPAAALPDHVVAGTPVDDSFALDVAETSGFGTASSSCTGSFVAASGLDATTADCIHVTSALSDWVAVIATVASGQNELWMACSDDAGGFTFGLRWAGTVQGVTPMDDAAIGSGLIVSLVDDAAVVHHVVMWDQYADSVCPTSTVQFPGTAGTGPVPQAGGTYLSLDGSEVGSKGICYRPIDGVWTRGTAENATC